MGCKIGRKFRKVVLIDTVHRITSIKEIIVQPGLFIAKNPKIFSEVYKIGPLLKRTTLSEVYTCKYLEIDEKRAVKIFKKQEDSKNNYTQELSILKMIDHPNIIRTYEYFEDSKRIYVVMEFCEGGELIEEVLSKELLNEANTAKIMKQIFSALAYLHSKNIIHRGIKPEHILLEEKNNTLNIKIIDFSNAAVLNSPIEGNIGSPYFSSPEVKKGFYTYKADLWSAGIIMSLLLSGQPSFLATNNNDIRYFTAEDNFGFTDKLWTKISEHAKDLISKLLCPEEERLSAQECLEHPWIIENILKPFSNENVVNSVLLKLRNFHSSHKLREAVNTFIITQLISYKETRDLREVFRAMDSNGDGKLSMEELTEQYSHTLGLVRGKKEAERIMKEVDTDNNGFIDYTEFLKANLDSKKILSKENLKLAFQMFDKGSRGTISAAELKSVLEGNAESEDSVWQEIIQLVDQNSDGEIDLNEFQNLIFSSCLNN